MNQGGPFVQHVSLLPHVVQQMAHCIRDSAAESEAVREDYATASEDVVEVTPAEFNILRSMMFTCRANWRLVQVELLTGLLKRLQGPLHGILPRHSGLKGPPCSSSWDPNYAPAAVTQHDNRQL